uniref:Myosin regulatory light chain 2-like n=1 Tax=Hirondellea gigas TaxID=1518452 RepID=A0A2P2HW97_9CRUS
MPSKGSRSSSKKAKKSGSNVFDMFSQKQVAEFKDGFQIIDRDRDGVIGVNDLRSMFDEIGRIASEEELAEMLGESDGPLNFTGFMTMFANKSGGEVDDDELVAQAIRAFENEPGEIDPENFRLMLMSFGDKFSSKEVDDVFANIEIDEETGIIDGDALVTMLASSSSEEDK